MRWGWGVKKVHNFLQNVDPSPPLFEEDSSSFLAFPKECKYGVSARVTAQLDWILANTQDTQDINQC